MEDEAKPFKRPAPWKGRPRVKDAKERRFSIRVTRDQRAALEASADKAGLSVGAFSRAMLFGSPGPRAVRRPPVEKALLANLLGELGKLGSNVNQIAHHANARRTVPALHEIRLIRRDMAVMRVAALNALGLRP